MLKFFRYLAFFAVFTFPFAVSAFFERDLYFGLSGDADVTRLQEFLRDQKIYEGPITGGFFSLTRSAVSRFQEREGIAPAAGYFGPLTRARANVLLSSAPSAPGGAQDLIAALTAQIAALRVRLLELQAKLAQEQAEPEAPPPQETTQTGPPQTEPPASEPEPVIKEIRFSGSATNSFPDIVTSPLKLGEFTIKNTLDSDVGFIRLEADLFDAMDSSRNRGRKVYFLLRNGTTYGDTQLAKTEFTFHSQDPVAVGTHSARLAFPFATALKAGEERTFGVWIEALELVNGGSLELRFAKVLTADTAPITGSFSLKLTK